jgi:hypothetical protein
MGIPFLWRGEEAGGSLAGSPGRWRVQGPPALTGLLPICIGVSFQGLTIRPTVISGPARAPRTPQRNSPQDTTLTPVIANYTVRKGNSAQRGAILLATLVLFAVVVGMAGLVMAFGLAAKRPHRLPKECLEAENLAEAGVSEKISQMLAGDLDDLGDRDHPVASPGGGYWVHIDTVDPAERIYRLTSRGASAKGSVAVEAIVRPSVAAVYRNAVFAGNSSGDPDYVLSFSGGGSRGDRIEGDVYCGRHVAVSGGASVQGHMRARGHITGERGQEGACEPGFDFAGMHYESDNDYDLARLFTAATYESNALGGTAWQMPERNPAHIFRKNPTDRAPYTDATPGDDYFLEDPYETVHVDPESDGSDATGLSLSAPGDDPGSHGNRRVFYVEGNLWIFNLRTNSFKFRQAALGSNALTIAVRGNIYIGDNLFYSDGSQDGLALIALEDPAHPDSGNIYLGDPADGTLKSIEAYLYAENDFRDNDLDAPGSRDVTITGSLIAGDQVLVHRDFDSGHSRLTVNYDDRILTGRIDLPGIPAQGGRIAAYTVLSWRQVPAN